jgi:digeranylgeranylglycerophospholipid reductase
MSSSETCQWDVVVVGASFAGAACALAAREAGLRVCVLERKRDPGIRLHTTGIIVSEAAEETPLSRIPGEYMRRIERVRLYAPSLRSILLQRRDYYFLTTDTANVMRWLADELRAAGVELRLMQSFTDARQVDAAWQVEGLGRTRWLVGADGAKSRVAARAGLGRVRDFLYGVEYEFAGASLREPDALHCFVSKHYAPGYIGWAAQNPGGVQFGLAFRHRPSRSGVPDIDGLRARVGDRRRDRRASATWRPAAGTHRHRRRPALPHQARAALDVRSLATRLAVRPAARHRATALGCGTGLLPSPCALMRVAVNTLARCGLAHPCRSGRDAFAI